MLSTRTLQRSYRFVICIAIISSQLFPPQLFAADFYWDSDGNTSNDQNTGTGLGGSGTWDTSLTNWWNLSSLIAWPNDTGNDADNAIFSGPAATLPTGQLVTLGTTINANRLSFIRSGYTLTGGTLSLQGTTPGLFANLAESARIESQISGSAGLTKTGGGSIRLTNSSNSYSGTTTISNGILIISDQAALGSSTSAIIVEGGNRANPGNVTNSRGMGGGSLYLDGVASPITISRNLELQGTGPIGDRGAALTSAGNNLLSGAVTMGVAFNGTNVSTRVLSSQGTLTISNSLAALGTPGTTINSLGGISQAGVSNYNLTGTLTGSGTLEKSGSGTLFLNPSNTAGFSGVLRVSGSNASGQSSVRITAPNVLGTRTSTGTSSVIDLNSGLLEVRMDTPSLLAGGSAAHVYHRNDSFLFADHAVGSAAINGNAQFGQFAFEDDPVAVFTSRNGYSMSFAAAPVVGTTAGDNDTTFTNNLSGTLSFSGAFWSNSNNEADRTLTIGGNGNTTLTGNLIASAATFNHHLTKTGTGLLTISSVGSTLDGEVSVQGSLAITDFRSITNNTSNIVLGSTGATAGNLIVGTTVAPTAEGLTTSKPIVLNTTSASNSIYANQSGGNPVILNGAITKPNATSASLILGGSNTADNTLATAIPANGTGGLTKVGAGVWVLTAQNAYAGATTISGGTLKLKANAAASTIVPEAAANTVVFNSQTVSGMAGGVLEFTGFSGSATSESLGALTPTAGAGTVKLVSGDGINPANLSFTGLGATTAASSVNFDTTSSAGGSVTLTGLAATGATDLPGTANFQGHLYINGANFATIDASANVVAPNYGSSGSFQNAGSALVAGVHNQLTTNASTSATATISSLKLTTQTLTLGAGLTVSTGGILQTGGSATIQSNASAARTIGGAVAGTNVVIRVDGISDVLNLGSAGAPVNIASATTGGFTKNGAGTLVINGVNAQSGATTINEGTVRLGANSARLSAANTALVIRQGAVLDLNGQSSGVAISSLDGAGTITNSSSSAATLVVGNNTTGAGTFAGIIQNGVGVVNVTKTGTTGSPTWSGLNTYTGVTTIGGTTGSVTVDVLADGGVASGIGASSNAASNLVFTTTTGGLTYRGSVLNGELTVGTRSASTDRLFTLSGTLVGSGVTLTSNAAQSNSIVFSNTGDIAFGPGSAAQTLTFAGTSTGDNTFNPRLTNNGSNATSVIKSGTGIWKLGNADNTYTGSTTIAQGILAAVDGDGLPASSNLTFNGGALYSQGTLTRDIGTAGNQMQFLPAAANTAQFSGGFLGGDSKLTVNWTGTPIWGSTAGFIDTRDGLILNGSQARGQAVTTSNALSEVEVLGNFSLGSSAGTNLGPGHSFTLAQNSSTVTVASTAGLQVGQSVSGTNIPAGAYIVSILSSTTFQMSANTANNSGVVGTFTDGVISGGSLRAIRVDDNAQTGADFATISGVISGASGTGIRKLGSGVLKLSGGNTYSGETNVYQGTLSVLSLGNSSVLGPTSVGTAANANLDSNAVTLGNGSTGAGILQYLGSGETSDRKIRLNTTTGSTQIHADGTGPLILTNVANEMVNGVKSLTLRGTNQEGNMITSNLGDFGGALSLTVDGGATWILSGNNTYTGATSPNAGALGIGSSTAVGNGLLSFNNGVVFAYGADRTISNTLDQDNNTTTGFTGDYSLSFTNSVAYTGGANNFGTNNSLAAGKTLTFGGLTANSITANRIWTVDGTGTTIINGPISTTQTTNRGLQIVKTGDGILQLNSGVGSNFNRNNQAIDLDRGRLRLGGSEVIPDGLDTQAVPVAYGGLTFTPEAATEMDIAIFDLNGNTETINSLTATTAGTAIIDNTSASPATFRFGANNSTVNFGSGTGTYAIQNTGDGALSIVKLGNTSTTFISGITLAHEGITASEGGGMLTIASPVSATSGLRAIESSTLALTGGITNPGLITNLEVGGGSTLSLLDGTGSAISNLTSLKLGNTGTGTATLNLNVGDLNTSTDRLNTDTITLLTGGTLNLGNSVTFNLTDAGLNSNQTYTLLNLIDGGINAFGVGNMIQGTTPGGFTSMNWTVTDNVVQLTTGSLLINDLYWRGVTNNTWNSNANNWSLDKVGNNAAMSIPGQGNTVIFAYDGVGTGALTTTLEQNFKINALEFESGATTPASVTINPGTLATARIEIAPQVSSEGITLSAGAPAAVNVAANLRLGANQTWHVADASSTLTVSGALLGESDVTKTGPGKVTLSSAADATFNGGLTTDINVNAGTFEITNIGALGSLANSNLANVAVNGGAFYYNNAVAGTVANPLTFAGGTLSAGGTNQTYSGTVLVNGASMVNLADLNGVPSATARNITLSGQLTGGSLITVNSNNTEASGNQISGNLILTNANNSGFSGGFNILRGIVLARSGNANALGTGPINVEFGRVEWEGAGGDTFNVNNSLTVARSGGGAVVEWNVDRSSGTGPFSVVHGGAITLGGAGVGQTGELRVFLQDDPDTSATFNGNVTLANNSAIHVRENATNAISTFSGNFSESGGARSLTINGPAPGGTLWGGTAGIIALNGTNTYTGGTNLAAGTLRLGNKDALGSSTLTITGTSTLQATTDLIGVNALPNAVAQNATLTVSGSENLTISGVFTGNGGDANRTVTNNLAAAKTLVLGGTVNLGPATNTLARTQTFGGSGNTSITGSVLNGNAFANALAKNGPGVLTLSNTGNAYTGGTVINEGILRSLATNVIPNTGTVTVRSNVAGNPNATLDLNGFSDTIAALTFGGTGGLANSVNSVTTGAGILTLGGNVSVNSTGDFTTAPFISGRLSLGTGIRTFTIADSTGSAVDLDVQAIVSNTGGITKAGVGVMLLSGVNTYSGATTINTGALVAGSTQAFGNNSSTTVGSGATLALASFNNSLGSLAGSGTVTNGGPSNVVLTTGGNNTNTSFSGLLENGTGGGSLGLTKVGTGTLALTGANTYTGLTSINQGTLALGDGGNTGSINIAGAISIGAGATFAVAQSDTVAQGTEFSSAAITGAGSFAQAGTGTTVLNVANTYSGTTTITAGALSISSDGNLGSVPGSPVANQLTMNGGKLAVTGNTAVNVNRGVTLGANNGTIDVAAAINLDVASIVTGAGSLAKVGTGTLNLTNANTYTGTTAVNNGTLLVNNTTGSGTGTGAVTVAAGATLGGNGTIGGATTIDGVHSPGTSPGIQTFVSDLTYGSGGQTPSIVWELLEDTRSLTDRGSLFDGIDVGGNLNFSDPTTLRLDFSTTNGSNTVNWSDTFWDTSYLNSDGWLVFDVAGTKSNINNLAIALANSGNDGASNPFASARPGSFFSIAQVGNDVYLNYTFTAVPEPASLGGGLVLFGTWLLRRRNRAKTAR